ncbi:hypothetical protein BG452_43395 [Streptomyces sp. CBMA123]|nr:hypothetical protein [Streptomyces sp. CBMA123]
MVADAFTVRRLHEWALPRTMTLGEPWEQRQLLTASNWLRLHTAETPSAGACLSAFAEGGRTRRIRHLAASRLRQLRRREGAEER